MEFILTTRGSRQVVHNGYLYKKKKTLASGITYWECTQRRSGDGCKGRIAIAADDTFLRISIDHTHPMTIHILLCRKRLKLFDQEPE